VFKEMVSLLNPEELLAHPSWTDPLFQACELLGTIQKIDFVLPSDLPTKGEISTQIAAICNASTIRYRQVRLTRGWWRDDSGPLLGFYSPEQRPVVLRRKQGFYEMIDPVSKRKRIVTDSLAKEILPLGYSFYRPFPKHLKRTRSVDLLPPDEFS